MERVTSLEEFLALADETPLFVFNYAKKPMCFVLKLDTFDYRRPNLSPDCLYYDEEHQRFFLSWEILSPYESSDNFLGEFYVYALNQVDLKGLVKELRKSGVSIRVEGKDLYSALKRKYFQMLRVVRECNHFEWDLLNRAKLDEPNKQGS